MIPDEWSAHENSGFQPEGGVDEVEPLEVLPQAAIDHLVAILDPRETRNAVLGRGPVEVNQVVVFGHQLIQRRQNIPEK